MRNPRQGFKSKTKYSKKSPKTAIEEIISGIAENRTAMKVIY
jgi:hypothetical protein